MIHRERLAAIEKGIELPPLEQEIQRGGLERVSGCLAAGRHGLDIGRRRSLSALESSRRSDDHACHGDTISSARCGQRCRFQWAWSGSRWRSSDRRLTPGHVRRRQTARRIEAVMIRATSSAHPWIRGQSPGAGAATPLTFDVTSVKPNTSGEQGGSSRGRARDATPASTSRLRRVMGLAYLPVQEFVGGPDWINTERFDIEGKTEGTPNQDQMMEMLRSLLADSLQARRASRDETDARVRAHAGADNDGRLGAGCDRAAPCEPPAPPASPTAHARADAVAASPSATAR